MLGYTLGDLDGNTNAGTMLSPEDVFVSKFTDDGNKIWTKQWGSDQSNIGYSIKSDEKNNLFITGGTYGVLGENTNAGGWDIFLTKWLAD